MRAHAPKIHPQPVQQAASCDDARQREQAVRQHGHRAQLGKETQHFRIVFTPAHDGGASCSDAAARTRDATNDGAAGKERRMRTRSLRRRCTAPARQPATRADVRSLSIVRTPCMPFQFTTHTRANPSARACPVRKKSTCQGGHQIAGALSGECLLGRRGGLPTGYAMRRQGGSGLFPSAARLHATCRTRRARTTQMAAKTSRCEAGGSTALPALMMPCTAMVPMTSK
jgi:hypothetical protein